MASKKRPVSRYRRQRQQTKKIPPQLEVAAGLCFFPPPGTAGARAQFN
jgi:hypothetical protein